MACEPFVQLIHGDDQRGDFGGRRTQQMDRQNLHVAVGLLATVMATVFTRTTADSVPNVILVMADDQGWGDVGYNTYTYQNPAYNYTWKFNPPRCAIM
jgi:hypothetical protein